MRGINYSGADDARRRSVLDQYLDVGSFGDHGRDRSVQVSFTERCVLEQLAEAGKIALGRDDVTVRLDGVGTKWLVTLGDPSMRCGHRDQDVVTFTGLECTEDGLDGRLARFDVDHLVADCVAIQGRWRCRNDVGQSHVGISEDETTAGYHVGLVPGAFGKQRVEFQMARFEGMVGGCALIAQFPDRCVDDGRRDLAVVQQRRIRGETFLSHQLFVVEVAGLVTVLGVTLRWDVAELSIERHDGAPSVLFCLAHLHQIVNTLTKMM